MLLSGLLMVAFGASTAAAQEPQSAAVAKELVAALDQGKLDSIAAKDAAQPDVYVAALYFPGQLLVVSAKYSVPVILNDKLAKKEFRDIYIDLNSASVPNTKILVMDLGCDGLRVKRGDNQIFDTFETSKGQVKFDGDWKAQKLSEADYVKAFQDADSHYARMLKALLAQVKKTTSD
jgi:hypothetical protein